MSDSQRVTLPQLAWCGDTELEIDFPATWDVTVCPARGYNAPPLDDAGLRAAYQRSNQRASLKHAGW